MYERLTANQNLRFFGNLWGMDDQKLDNRIAELLDVFGLSPRSGDRVSTFSKGMRQRLAIARTLLHYPDILFLDEPTSGLDPESAQQVQEMVEVISKTNSQTVVICTHNLNEAQKLCSRLAIMKKGRLLVSGSLDELRQLIAPGLYVTLEFSGDANNHLPLLETFNGISCLEIQDTHKLRMHMSKIRIIPDIVSHLVSHGARINAVIPHHLSLDEIYFKLQEGYEMV